jgi:type II secretory pathway pseudopilin PulG
LKYPSSKNFILLVVAVVIIVSAFLISEYENRVAASQESASEQNSQGQATNILATTTMYNTPIVSEGNWQKALSDAFGTSSAWRDSTTNSTSATAEATLTPTDMFSEDLFSKYASYQQAGADLTDPDTQQQLIGQVMADGTYIPSPKTYDISDIKISSDSSTDAVITYSTNLQTIFEKDLGPRHQDELTIVQTSLDNDDPSILKQLDPTIASYTLLLKDLLAMRVPTNMADMHINLVNPLSELLFADQGFTQTYTDGLTSIQGLSEYKNGAQDFSDALTAIIQYFNANGIPFSYQQQ